MLTDRDEGREFSMTCFYFPKNMISFQLVIVDFFSIWKQSNKMNAWNKFIKHIPPYFCFVTHLQTSLLFLEFPWKNDRFSDLPLASLAAMLIILHLPSAFFSSFLLFARISSPLIILCLAQASREERFPGFLGQDFPASFKRKTRKGHGVTLNFNQQILNWSFE